MASKGSTQRQLARRELIVYLTPIGPLGNACERYLAMTKRNLGPTTAHTYPPHISLTGFFRRTSKRADEVIAEFGARFGENLIAPPESVKVIGLKKSANWVGLEVQSTWAQERVAEFVEHHVVQPGDDAIRPKDWLHLSLAYGALPDDVPLASYGTVAREEVDPSLAGTWTLGLWERSADGNWIHHH